MDGEIIRKLREVRGYKQEYLATKLGITVKAYSKLECGETKLTIDRLREVTRILGFKPEIVLNFSEQSLLEGANSSIYELPKATDDTDHSHCKQRIQYLEKEVKFLRHLLNRVIMDKSA